MSRYNDDFRSSAGHLPSGGGGQRWDADRYMREREIERERERYRSPPAAPVLERPAPWEVDRERYVERRGPLQDERYFYEEKYGPPARAQGRQYYDGDREMSVAGPMILHERREERVREEAPPSRAPRPGLLRRQSSLDTFDRKPTRRFDRFEDYEQEREYFRAPAPPAPPPVVRQREREREEVYIPRRRTPPREDYEDIRIAEPDYYGDEEFRKYREREWVMGRRRRSNERSRSRGPRESEREIIKEVIEERVEEKPFPRRGKTRMPKRLVHTRAIIELGYPYEEEGETIIILKALGKENIDEVVSLSREYREKEQVTEVRTVHLIEAPPAHGAREEIIEKTTERIIPMHEAPRSVREWDVLKSERSPSPARTHRSHSRHHSPRREEVIKEIREVHREISPARTSRTRRTSRSRHHSPHREEIIKEIREIREVSPARTVRTRRHSSPRTEIIERRRIYEEDEQIESNSIHAGPLALVLPERRKNERDIKAEIRALEAERKALKLERQIDRERHRGEREIVIEKETPVVEIRKDRKAPDPRLIRAMMATLT